MKNICKIYKPNAMWKIESENGLYEYIHPDMKECLDYLMKKYNILYNDILDVLCKESITYTTIKTIISTEIIEDYDLKLNYIDTDKDFCCYYKWDNTVFYMLKRFCIFFDLFNNPKDLYFKVIPLEILC